MNWSPRTFPERVRDLLASVGAQVRSAFAVGIPEEDAREAKRLIDPDFDGWLQGDPSVTKNPASRYGDKNPGYVTGNGLGSMEIGAADD